MTSEEYKALSVKEFTEVAKVYDSGHSGIYEMCKVIILIFWKNWKKSPLTLFWTVAAAPVP